ncbi:MAG: hypothetical protein QM689_03425 [Oscillospiraceae bacterium]
MRTIIPAYDQEGLLWKRLMEETGVRKLVMANLCDSLAVFHDKEYRESDVDVEVQITVQKRYNIPYNPWRCTASRGHCAG